MTGSTDAIAHVQEGIVVDVNPAWASSSATTTPSDAARPAAHGPVRRTQPRRAQGRAGRGRAGPLDRPLAAGDGRACPADRTADAGARASSASSSRASPPCACASPRRSATSSRSRSQLEEALRLDSRTGLLRARRVLRAGQGARGAAAQGRPARRRLPGAGQASAASSANCGPIVRRGRARRRRGSVREQLQPGDLAAASRRTASQLLVERGNAARPGRLARPSCSKRIAAERVPGRRRNVDRLTCSIGSAPLHGARRRAADATARRRSRRSARRRPPAATAACTASRPVTQPELDEADRAWAGQIKAALMANRFRLVQQPIASLVGDDRGDVRPAGAHARRKGQEVLPSEFLAAAERTDLMKNIDRWVVGAAMSFCAAQQAAPRVRAPVARLDARPDARHLAAAAAEGLGRRPEPHRVRAAAEEMATQHLTRGTVAAGPAVGARLRARDRALRRGGATRPQLLHRAAGQLREDRRRADAGPRQRPLAAGAGEGAGRAGARRTARPRSPSASRTPTRWPCCGSSASSSSRAISSTARKKW